MVKRVFNQKIFEQYQQQGCKCVYCSMETPFELITRDHFYPVSKGNTLVQNKVFACRRCNSTKSDLSLEEFRELVIKIVIKTLRSVLMNQWKISQRQCDTIKWSAGVLNTLSLLEKNGGTPDILFT